MKFTRSTRCPKSDPCRDSCRPEFFRRLASAARRTVLGFVFSLPFLSTGCETPGEVHEDYASLRPARVDLRIPDKTTIQNLRAVAFGGLLQRTITGPRTYDVLEILRAHFGDILLAKGYQPTPFLSQAREEDFRGPVESTDELPFDAVLYSTVERWGQTNIHPRTASATIRVSLHSVPGGELLYSKIVEATMSDGRRDDSQGKFLEKGLKSAAYKLLRELPDSR